MIASWTPLGTYALVGLPPHPTDECDLPASRYVEVMRQASELPEIKRIDRQIQELRAHCQQTEKVLATPPDERPYVAPMLYFEARDVRERSYRHIRPFISIASWGLAFGLTRLPALQPVASLIWIATFLGAIPRTVDHFVMKGINERVEHDVTNQLEQSKQRDLDDVQALQGTRDKVFDSALRRLMKQAASDEAARRADPNARVEVEEDQIVVGGVSVPRKR